MKVQLLTTAVLAVALSVSSFAVAQETAEAPATQEAQQSPEAPQEVEAQEEAAPTPVPIPITDGVATLSPENTRVDFIGTHVGDNPDPRFGGFTKFAGTVNVDDAGAVTAMMVEFDTTSLWTTLGGNLDNHLKSADFLNVEAHPLARFEATKVAPSETEGLTDITGDFSFMGETKEISFPAKVVVDGSGVLIMSDFTIDRTMFGMSGMVERVSPEVNIKMVAGLPTTGPDAEAEGQRAGGGQRQGRGGGMDPAQLFGRFDANGDGKITEDEMPDRMKERVEEMDSDGDGSITLEELQAAFERRSHGGGGGR